LVGNRLCFGLEASRFPIPTGAERIGIGYQPGVWIIPVSELEPAFSTQKQIQLAQKASTIALTEQTRKDLLAKYDRNHNGIWEAEEKAAALNDPDFIKSELDTIDANQNGCLDPEELRYFDVNQNKILEANEQAGIDAVQHFLVTQIFKQFDADGDGFLNDSEFNDWLQSDSGADARALAVFAIPFSYNNHNGRLDPGEVKSYLDRRLRNGLRLPRNPGFFAQPGMAPRGPAEQQELFKAAVEAYWQNAAHQPINPRIRPGAGVVTNNLPGDKVPERN
jgi:hypothetical protein